MILTRDLPHEYRVTCFGEPRSEWRDTRDHAMDDAIRLGLASYDESRREHYLAVPIDIEKRPISPT